MKNVFSRTRCKGIHNCVRTQYFKKNNATAPFFIDINQENNILKNLMLREIMTFSMIGSYVPDLQLTSCLKQLRNWKS